MDSIVGRMVLYSLCVASDVFGDLTNPLPQNQAVLRGTTRVAFNCSSNYGWNFISWSITPVGETASRTISVGIIVISSSSDIYEVSSAGDITNILTIKRVNESLAGTYFCSVGSTSASSQLIVYNTDPVCTSNPSSGLSPSQVVQMSCAFNYSASFPFVNMVWYKGSSLISSESSSNSTSGILTTTVSTIYQTVNYSSPFPAFKCQTSFRVTGSNATNVPSYLNTAIIPEKNVHYFNPNCSIEGATSENNVYQGSSIICKAYANPLPNYRWSKGTNRPTTLATSSAMQIWNDGEYTCAAWNEAGSCRLSINLTVYDIRSTTPVRVPSKGHKDITIGVVVGICGVLLLCLLIFIICRWFRKSRKGTNDQHSSENEREEHHRPSMRQSSQSAQNGDENIAAYEMLTDLSREQPPVYCQLAQQRTNDQRSPEFDRIEHQRIQRPTMKQDSQTAQNGSENITAYEMLTDRFCEQPPVYCQLT